MMHQKGYRHAYEHQLTYLYTEVSEYHLPERINAENMCNAVIRISCKD